MKEKQISKDLASAENIIRHAYNQGYEQGLKDSKQESCTEKPCLKELCRYYQKPCEDWHDVPSDEMTLEQARQAVRDLRKMLADHLEQEPYEDWRFYFEHGYEQARKDFIKLVDKYRNGGSE